MTQLDPSQPGTNKTRWRLPARAGYACLAAFWLAQTLVNVWWLKVDTRPPFYDTAGHAMLTFQLARAPFVTAPLAAGKTLLGMGPYPPFVYLASVPFALLFGPSVDALIRVHAIFLAILLAATYELGRRLDRPATGLTAALLVGMYPILYGLSRHYLLDLPLVAMVALAVCCLVRAEAFQHLGASLLFGVAVGLGMLTKWTFVVFIVAPFVISCVAMVKEYSPARLRNMLLSVLAGGVIASPWYLANLNMLAGFFQTNGFLAAALEGDPPIVSLRSWLYYADALINHQLFLPFVVLFVLGLVLVLWKHKLDRSTGIVLAWVLVPYLLFSAFVNKDIRYVLPYLPAIALLTALGWAQVRNRRVARAIWAATAVYALFQYAGLSFGLSHRLGARALPAHVALPLGDLRLTLYRESVHLATPPRTENWRVQEILGDILEDSAAAEPPEGPIRLVVVTNRPYFETQGFRYYAHLDDLPVRVDSITGVRSHDGAEIVRESDYAVLKSGDLGPVWSLQDAAALAEAIRDPNSELGRQFVRIGEYALPDGSTAQLYRHERG